MKEGMGGILFKPRTKSRYLKEQKVLQHAVPRPKNSVLGRCVSGMCTQSVDFGKKLQSSKT